MIPLVEAADQRLKIARLSVALAARTFSTDDEGNKIIVRQCHVEYISEFLDGLYSEQAMGYKDYSAMIKRDTVLVDEEEVVKKLVSLPFASDAIRAMLETHSFDLFDLMDWTTVEIEVAREVVGLLVRKNAVKRGRRKYFKTPAFIATLKKVQLSGKVQNHSAEEIVDRVEKDF